MIISIQLCVLIIVTELFIYCFLSKLLDTFEHCSMMRTYRKALEAGLITPNEFENFRFRWNLWANKHNLKEEKENGNN